ncbi:MAG: hypothetical protein IJL66_08595 [Lachnospiraceae bacterium]|nr:hypothetical protein [Lachnospiraceae bacterium]
MMYPFLLLCGAAVLVLYIREKIRAFSVRALVLKSVVSALFIAVGIHGAYAAGVRGAMTRMHPFVLMGLLSGLLGDIWLDLKYVFPEKNRSFTLAGFSAFGIGHVFYMTGMLLRYFPSGRPMFAVLPFVLGAAASAANAALEKPMKLNFGEMRKPVILYGFLLFSMLFLAGGLALAGGWRETPLTLMFAGGVLFAVSDLILSGTYFGTGRGRPVDLASNYLTYYAGQFLIASALVF